MDDKVDIHMPLFIGDYLADTTDLTTEEHGAYLLILMHLWRNRGVTSSDHGKLARVAKLAPSRWKAAWQTLARFFAVDGGELRQKRLARELDKAVSFRQAASEAGKRSAAARAARYGSAKPPGRWPSERPSEPNQNDHQNDIRTTFGTESERPSEPNQKPLSSPSEETLGLAGAGAHDLPEAPHQPPPPEPRHRVDAFAAAVSADFDRVFQAYPRKDAKARAGLAFQALAATHPGGEKALADTILRAFPAMLKRAPYNGPNDKRPYLETVLAERRWEDPESAPDAPKAADPRCSHHRQQGTFRTLPRGGPVTGCPTCKENAAARGTREATPTAAGDALPKFKPPPAWTPEQLAEAEQLRKAAAEPPTPKAAAGGSK